ncbi:hypothetical protein PMAYCL1PPCAC_28376, partial [Pristionchus mayeri]
MKMMATRKRSIQDEEETSNERLEIKVRGPIQLDNFSQMPHDCLLDILERVDHNDLDEMCTLNRRFEELSILSRSRALKAKANDLVITQESPTLFHFSIHYHGDQSYYMTLSPETKSVLLKAKRRQAARRKKYSISPQQEDLLQTNSERLTNILQRFDIAICTFKSVCIDQNILKLIELICSSPSLFSLKVDDCFFRKQYVEKRFLDALLFTKVDTISLGFHNYEAQVVTQDFLRVYSNIVHLP